MKSYQKILFQVIGSPHSQNETIIKLKGNQIDEIFSYSFENRVALLFLEKLDSAGYRLTAEGLSNLERLRERRRNTDRVLEKITSVLNEKFQNEWVFFKTLKPFPSTPNDTDWFPFDVRNHEKMCKHLCENGFSFLEQAPLQTTLIEDSGRGIADSDKRGGVWYIDCYKQPGADYFIYLDPLKLKKHITFETIDGVQMPNLSPHAELSAICFHNVFPERTYSIETFYLILHYMLLIETEENLDLFIRTSKELHVVRAIVANLKITQSLHIQHFGVPVDSISYVLEELAGTAILSEKERNPIVLPHYFDVSTFWMCFFEKLQEPLSLKSLFVQFFHMLNPIFFIGVVRILIKRLSRGGTYKQM